VLHPSGVFPEAGMDCLILLQGCSHATKVMIVRRMSLRGGGAPILAATNRLEIAREIIRCDHFDVRVRHGGFPAGTLDGPSPMRDNDTVSSWRRCSAPVQFS